MIFALNLEYPINEIESNDGFYKKDARIVLDTIQKQKSEISSLMIFGHKPVITDLYNILSGVKLNHIPTSGVVCIQFESEEWSKIHKKTVKNIFIETGK